MIFDAGSGSTLLEFLDESAITEIDTVIISHADADHLSGLLSLLSAATVQVRHVHLNSDATKTVRHMAGPTVCGRRCHS